MADKNQESGPYPEIIKIECKACGRCVAACPKDVLYMSQDINERGYHYVAYTGEGCIGCANCFYTCPEPGAIRVHIPRKKKQES
jgi:2-oxoisovalerate ferredoxin oxidoreductase delta subunit